jgi:triosephosphate isomerase
MVFMKFAIANWKMELTLKESVKLARKIVRPSSASTSVKTSAGKGKKSNVKIILCPSFTSLEEVGKITNPASASTSVKTSADKKASAGKGQKIGLGAQDMFWKKEGAFTGEVSAKELKRIGVKYVILGHSERRKLGETDKIVRQKLEAALLANLTPILCIGETWEERNKGLVKKVLQKQISVAFKNLKINDKKIIIAYEPVWAIGTGRPAHPEDSKEASEIIKKELVKYLPEKIIKKQITIIYGGSVNSKIIVGFITNGGMSGALVGGASLDGEEFLKIIRNIE